MEENIKVDERGDDLSIPYTANIISGIFRKE